MDDPVPSLSLEADSAPPARIPPRLTGEMPAIDAQVIGGYAVIKPLGDGTEGVLLARHTKLTRVVTLKPLCLPEPADPVGVADFVDRARTAVRIQAPQLVEIYDFVEQGGRWWAVMEPIFGESLKSRVARTPLNLADAVAVSVRITEALAVLHQARRGHGAITTSNLFIVEREGQSDYIKLLDFGAASGQDELIEFTSLPPDRKSSSEADVHSDVWGVGSVLFELLEGRTPHEARRLSGNSRAGELIPEGLAKVVTRALEADPRSRFTGMESLSASMLHGLGLGPQPAPTQQSLSNLQKVASKISSPSLPPVGGPAPSSPSLPRVASGNSQPHPALLRDSSGPSQSHPSLPRVPAEPPLSAASAPSASPGMPAREAVATSEIALPRDARRRWPWLVVIMAVVAPAGVWWGLTGFEDPPPAVVEPVAQPPPPVTVAPKVAPIDPRLVELVLAKVGVGSTRGAAASMPARPVKKSGKKKKR